MKLETIHVSGFCGFEEMTTVQFVQNRVICVGANGSGKSNILRVVEFFLSNGTGDSVKLDWDQEDSSWEPHKRCVATLIFALNSYEQDTFAKWRVTSIIRLLSTLDCINDLITNLEGFYIYDESPTFTHLDMFPQHSNESGDIDSSPLFQYFAFHKASSSIKKKFWEMIEKALLLLYSTTKPYNTAIYYANTEPRDTKSVSFQQILCCCDDKERIVSNINNIPYNDDVATVALPQICTLEEEISTLCKVLTGMQNELSKNYFPEYRQKNDGSLITISDWNRVEEYMRYGMCFSTHTDNDVILHKDSKASTLEESKSEVNSEKKEKSFVVVSEQKKRKRRVYSDITLSTCGFLHFCEGTANHMTKSLIDVRTWCKRLILRTERYMKNRSSACQLKSVRGITHILRRLLLRSVCILPQDRIQPSNGNYLCMSQEELQNVVMRLTESSDRADMQAMMKIQLGMKAITGHEVQSQRLANNSTGGYVVGLQNSTLGKLVELRLKNVGGGHKEVLMVLLALHGVMCDTVLLDSPGYSLHPPQQKSLALWISKFLFDNSHQSPSSPSPYLVSVMIITNSTEFVTEDALPCLYCFRRVIASTVRAFKAVTKEKNSCGNSGSPKSTKIKIYKRPDEQSPVGEEVTDDTVIFCRNMVSGFLELASKTGYVVASSVAPVDAGDSISELVTSVNALRSSKLQVADELKILEPDLKRLVFATGVFFFEGQTDYRVVEALKHIASGLSWEIVIMHGSGEIPKVTKIVESLNIPFGIVVDYDQIMPTVKGIKNNDNADMRLWRSSAVYRFLSNHAEAEHNSSKTEASQIAAPPWTVEDTNASRSIEDLLDILASFNRGDANSEIMSQIQNMTSELESRILTSDIMNALQRYPGYNGMFSKALKTIEIIINTNTISVGIRASLIRRELRDVGIFTWNSDLEGMIFGYGEPKHDVEVVRSIPTSMKSFCIDQEETLSGWAYFKYGNIRGDSKVDKDDIDDLDRIVFIIRYFKMFSIFYFPKLYKIIFGARFRGEINGIQYPFNYFVEKLQTDPRIRISHVSSSSTKSSQISTPQRDEVEVSKSVTASVTASLLVSGTVNSKNNSNSCSSTTSDGLGATYFKTSGSINAAAELGVEQGEVNDEEYADSVSNDVTYEDDGCDDLHDTGKKGGVPRSKDNRRRKNEKRPTSLNASISSRHKVHHSEGFGESCNNNITANNSGYGNSKSAYNNYNTNNNNSSGSTSTGKKAVDKVYVQRTSKPPRQYYDKMQSTKEHEDVNVDEDDEGSAAALVADLSGEREFIFEWIGEYYSEEVEFHPQSVFSNANYWHFVGSVLHGGHDKGGMWKQLPWLILKDLIFESRHIRLSDNVAGKFMSPEDVRRFGKSCWTSPVHVGLQDLLNWMEHMETRNIIPSP